MLNKIFCIIGKSGSGKSTLFNKLKENSNFEPIYQYTTRQKRDDESYEFFDYKFISNEFFNELKNQDILIFTRSFYIETLKYMWQYGFNKNDFINLSKSKYLIIEPRRFLEIKEKYKNQVLGIYLYIGKREQLNRLSLRKENLDKIEDRIKRDSLDFKLLDTEHNINLWLNAESLKEENIYKRVIEFMEKYNA